MKNKLFKNIFFWISIILILVLGYVTYSGGNTIIDLKSENSKMKDDLKTTQKILDTYGIYISQVYPEIRKEQIDFYVDRDKVILNKGEKAYYDDVTLTVNYINNDSSGLLATTLDNSNLVLVGISLDNQSKDNITFNPKKFFLDMNDRDYVYFDSFMVGDGASKVDDNTVVVEPNKVGYVVLSYDLDEKYSINENFKVMYGSTTWLNK